MIGSRVRKVAIVVSAGVVATVGTLALSPFSASADGPVATTTTLTGPASVTTGHGASFVATVAPSKTATSPVIKATGTVTFTITGSDSSSVDCTGAVDALALSGKGKAVCKVDPGSLSAAAAPYTVSAIYTGDDNFAGGPSNVLSQDVSSAKTHVKITYDVKPVSGASTTFTATVTGGAGSLPTGKVVFPVSSSAGNGKTNCNPGPNSRTLAPSSDAVPVAQATCTLAANWFKVSTTDPHPHSSWNVTASYVGDGNYNGSEATKSGTSKS